MIELAGYRIRPLVMLVQEFPERRDFILKHFKEVGIESEEFNCFSGVHSGLYTIHPYEVDDPGSGWTMGSVPVCNWISQYMLWTTMLYMPEAHFMQLEWDAKFTPDWKPRLDAALHYVPKDFDVLFVGSCCALKENNKLIGGDVWEVRYPMCNHAMIIAKKAIPTMLRTQRKVYAKMDISLNFHTFNELKVYTVIPRIADQWNTHIHP